jgi:hypothetical protein
VEGKGWIAGTITLFTLIVAFFQLADSPTFQAYVWQPLSHCWGCWSADDWSALGYQVFGFAAGVWMIYLAWRGIVLGALRSYWWFVPPIYVILLSAYRHARWMGWW